MRKVSVDSIWMKIKPYVNDIVSPCRLTSDQIYKWCESERAHIFVVDEGFFIVKPQLGIDDERVLFVLVAYGQGVNLFEKYSKDVVQLAKDIGASRVEFSSHRNGWEKVAPQCGYKKRETIYELEVAL